MEETPALTPRHCAACGERLTRRRVAGRLRPQCPRCGRVAYRNPKPCAGALVERDDGAVLLVRRAVAPYRGWWDIPGGFLEADEHPERGAVRELREETGLRVRLVCLLGVYVDRGPPATLNLYYLARATGGRARASDDAVALGWFHRGELPRRIAYPRHARRVLADWRRLRPAC